MLNERSQIPCPDGPQAADGLIHIAYACEHIKARKILMAAFTDQGVRTAG